MTVSHTNCPVGLAGGTYDPETTTTFRGIELFGIGIEYTDLNMMISIFAAATPNYFDIAPVDCTVYTIENTDERKICALKTIDLKARDKYSVMGVWVCTDELVKKTLNKEAPVE